MIPKACALDKAYDHQFVRDALEDRGLTAHIRSRGEEAKDLREDPIRHARRWVVERVHSWINRYRSLLIRWTKRNENHEALLMFCFALISSQQLSVTKSSGQALSHRSRRSGWALGRVGLGSGPALRHRSRGPGRGRDPRSRRRSRAGTAGPSAGTTARCS